jgi:CBS domain-containing protein
MIKTRNMMDTNVVFVDEEESVADTVKLMLEQNVWSVIVTRDNLPVGVVTERDVLRKVIGKGYDTSLIKARDIASAPIYTISPDAPLGEALKIMVENNIRRVFVVDEGRIVGRVTQTESIKNMLNVLLSLASLHVQA